MLRLSFLCLVFSITTAAQAASVVWGAAFNGIDVQNGSDAPVGSLVRMGFFNLSDADIQAHALDIPFLSAAFTEYGSALIGDGNRPAGHFQSITNNNTATATALAGSQIYVWAFSSGTVANSAQHGIFYMPKGTSPNWQFPAQVPIAENTQIELQELTDAAGTVLKAGAKVLVGTFGLGTSDDTGKPNFGLVPVPEPGSATLLMAAGGVIGFIRRRS